MAPNSSLRAVQGGLVAISHTGEDFVIIMARALDMDRTHQVGAGAKRWGRPGQDRTVSRRVCWGRWPLVQEETTRPAEAHASHPEPEARVTAEDQGRKGQGCEHDVCECVGRAYLGPGPGPGPNAPGGGTAREAEDSRVVQQC